MGKGRYILFQISAIELKLNEAKSGIRLKPRLTNEAYKKSEGE